MPDIPQAAIKAVLNRLRDEHMIWLTEVVVKDALQAAWPFMQRALIADLLSKPSALDRTLYDKGKADGIEAAAKRCDELAYIELCADDTARGSANARPYQNAAAAIRTLKPEVKK